jgi:hypothetical protein
MLTHFVVWSSGSGGKCGDTETDLKLLHHSACTCVCVICHSVQYIMESNKCSVLHVMFF